ncbi:MAG: right-handed parallel beta-helix repeat-containing protein [Planctomycetota bacterium]|nr:right-handed parallel beta-helix repeat-containing protein [Planctomycetota bacterium]
MNRIAAVVAGLSLALVGTSATIADTIHVPGDYPTIQGAVDAANNGDEIIVAPGTYTGTGDPVVDMLGKTIWLHSSDGPETTIIDGQGERRGLLCDNGETADIQVEGFTIRNGSAPLTDFFNDGNPNENRLGGGILVRNSSPILTNCIFENNLADGAGFGGAILSGTVDGGISEPTFSDCTISGNTATYSGGGIYCYQSSPTITDCTISDNTANYGGGTYCENSNPIITDCTISGNTANTAAGGIHLHTSNSTITDCTISGNTADYYGGGITCFDNSNPTISGCTIEGNQSDYGGGISLYDLSTPTISGCTISGNTAQDEGGGIYHHTSSSNSILSDTILCGNDPDQIYGDWTDDGGNEVDFYCPGPCAPFAQDFGYESGTEYGAVEMAVSGDLAVVLEGNGEQHDVRCYYREQGEWKLEAIRNAPFSTGTIFYPCKRADFSGDLVIVRPDKMSPGGFSILNRDGGNWTEEFSSDDGADDGSFEPIGISASISGNHAVIGNTSQTADDAHAIVYQRDSNATWTQQTVLTCPLDDSIFFGVEVAIDGDHLIVSSLAAGAFYYRYDGSSWQYIQHLTHPDVTQLGTSVDISGDVAVIGSYYDQSPAGTEGAMVFRLVNGNWMPEQRLDSPDVIDLGYSVRIDGDLIVATSGINSSGSDVPGKAHVFRHQDGTWVEIDRINGDEVTDPGWITTPRISISGLQVATAYYIESAIQFQDITLHTYPPPGEPSGLDCNANDRCDELDIASGNSEDCNGNAIPDECDIADGTSIDENGDGVPDECQCPGDATGDGLVDVNDVLYLISVWDTPNSNADFDGNGLVDADDVIILLNHYGESCP